MRHLSALLCWIIYWEHLSKEHNNLMPNGLRYCWANVQGSLIGRGGFRSFFHGIDHDMKDITSLCKTMTFPYSKSNMTNIVTLALIKSAFLGFINYRLTQDIVNSTTRCDSRNSTVIFVCSENPIMVWR